jgi:hypothetical protein
MKKAAFFMLFMAGVAVIKANTTSLSLFEAIQKKMVKAKSGDAAILKTIPVRITGNVSA